MMKELLNQYDNNYHKEILPQITELIEKGIIDFEYGEVCLLHKTNEPGFEVKQNIKLIDKVSDKISTLEKEILRLNEIIDGARYS